MKHLMMMVAVGALLALPALADGDEEFELLYQQVRKQAVSSAKITAQQAIAIAAKEAGHARLVELAIYLKGAEPVFGLEFLGKGGELEIVIDAVSGKVLEKERDEDEDEDEDEAEAYEQACKLLAAAQVTLPQAITRALAAVPGGKVVEAEAEVEHGKLEYEVELLVGGVFKEVELDATGKVKEIETEKAVGHAWTFDADTPGKPPAGWKFDFTRPKDGQATWTVKKDAKAFSGTNVLTLKADSAGHVFNVAMALGTSYKDVMVRTRLRPETGREDQGGGVIWRCKDADNYYICRLNPLESNFRVYKVVDGRRRKLDSARIEAQPGKWYAIRARMVGDHITCYVDGKKLLDVHDDTFKDAGMVGLWTKADASSSFDNVAAQPACGEKEHHEEEMESGHGKKHDGHGDKDDDEDDDDDD